LVLYWFVGKTACILITRKRMWTKSLCYILWLPWRRILGTIKTTNSWPVTLPLLMTVSILYFCKLTACLTIIPVFYRPVWITTIIKQNHDHLCAEIVKVTTRSPDRLRVLDQDQLCLTRVTHNSLRLTNPWPSKFPIKFEFEMLTFVEGGTAENPERNHRS